MSFSVSTAGPYFSSGSISFSDLRNTFRGTDGTISASELRRDTSVDSEYPVVPDATENSSISSSSNLKLSQFRNSIKYYDVTQDGTDSGVNMSSMPWNSNLGKNIRKKFFINGTINSAGAAALRVDVDPSYNLGIDVNGGLYGYGGAGGIGGISDGSTTSSTTTSYTSTVSPYLNVRQSNKNSSEVYVTSSGSGRARIKIKLRVDDDPSIAGKSFNKITITGDGTTIVHDYIREDYEREWEININAGVKYRLSFTGLDKDLGRDPGALNQDVNAIPQNTEVNVQGLGLRDEGGNDCNARIFIAGVMEQYVVSSTTISGGGIGGTGSKGGNGINVFSSAPVYIYIAPSGRIWSGGGGGGGGASGENGPPGVCTYYVITVKCCNCGSAPGCGSATKIATIVGGPCDCKTVTTKKPDGSTVTTTVCSSIIRGAICLQVFPYAVRGGYGGQGGTGGIGQGVNGGPGSGVSGSAGEAPYCPNPVLGPSIAGQGVGSWGGTGKVSGSGGAWGQTGNKGNGPIRGGLGGPPGYSIKAQGAGRYFLSGATGNLLGPVE